MNKILPRSFYELNTVIVAQKLLGKKIIRQIDDTILSGYIIETEAYTFDDPACHAYRGKTEANKALFGQVGHAYIYFIYGNHYCLNLVAKDSSQYAGGVLIRALQPIDGIEIMKKLRNKENIKDLTNGPGKLAQALNITKKLYGVDVTKNGPIYLTEGIKINNQEIISSGRIGISKAQEKLWRFYIAQKN